MIIRNFFLLLCPARATTKVSLAVPQHPFAGPAGLVVPARGRGSEANCSLNKLAVATSPIGRKHQHVLQITLYC